MRAAARRRGIDAEKDVLRLWHRAGWTSAYRTPGSGSIRYDGADPVPMFPLDIASGWPDDYGGPGPARGPWMVEVKRVAAADSASRGFPGEAFTRAALRKANAQVMAVNRTAGGRRSEPVLFIRGAGPWLVWVGSCVMLRAYGSTQTRATGWTALDPATFFAEVARTLLDVA